MARHLLILATVTSSYHMVAVSSGALGSQVIVENLVDVGLDLRVVAAAVVLVG